MQCPKCKATVPGDSKFCQICGSDVRSVIPIDHGTPRYDPFSTLGDLDQDTNANIQDDNVIGFSHNGGRKRVYYVGEDGLWRDKEIDEAGREIPPVAPKRNTLFCTGCGKPTPADSVFCEHCGKQLLTIPTQKKFHWKKWMTVAVCCVVLLMGIILVSAVHDSTPDTEGYPNGENAYVEPLSASCDFVLCQGSDTSGNTYELVANQTESSLGYEITVGVIKNNAWLYPMSSDFPFLGEDGLFHVSVSMAGDSGTSLAQVNEIIQNIYFVDSGAFLMDSYKETDSWVSTYDHYNIIFSCNSLESYTVNCKESTLLYRYSEATFSNGQVESYGRIFTENGEIVLYTETSGTSSGWLEDQVFDWSTLNVQTLNLDTITSGIAGVRPESILSEGLVFASDQCFYNTSGQKVIDLSEYNIDMWYNGDIYFEGGTCTFIAENSLGTEFLITIDKSGNVLSEVEK